MQELPNWDPTGIFKGMRPVALHPDALRAPSTHRTLISVPFCANVVPKGCRSARDVWFFDDVEAEIRVVDAETAFRVSFPKSRRFEANRLDVIFFEGRYWWPFHFDDERSCLRGTVGNTLRKFRTGGGDLLGLRGAAQKFPTARLADVPPREILSSNFDAAAEIARQKIASNILICHQRIYQLGGEPVWIQRHGGRAPKIGIASVGAYRDRTGDPKLGREVGHFQHDDVQQCLGWGRFWFAHERDTLMDWMGRTQKDELLPGIDASSDCLPRVPRKQVQLDALFASVSKEMATFLGHYGPEPQTCTQEGLAYASDQVPDSELSRRRLDVLSDFLTIKSNQFYNEGFGNNSWSLQNSIRRFDPDLG